MYTIKAHFKRLKDSLRGIKLPVYGNKKLILAFEYGVMISETAKDMKIDLTPEIIKRAENIILKEFRVKNLERLAVDMLINILATFETN